jgi:hypothetical protein
MLLGGGMDMRGIVFPILVQRERLVKKEIKVK